MTLSDLNNLPDFLNLFIIIILGYITYQIYQYRKIVLTLSLVAIIAYVCYISYGNHQLTQTVKQITYTKPNTDFNNSGALGYRQNNPGNIRNAGPVYKGEISTSSAFKQFENMSYGFRAMASLLHSYIQSGHNTVAKILYKYAPPTDGNNTAHYISSVCKAANVKEEQVLSDYDFKNGNMLNIMYHMTKVEQGYPPNIQDLTAGFNMFLNEANL